MDITPDRSYWLAFVFAAVMELLPVMATILAHSSSLIKIELEFPNTIPRFVIEIKSKIYFFYYSYFIDIIPQQHVTDEYKLLKK